MKKAFSIFLISVMIFGIVGYELIFSVLLFNYKETAEKYISSEKETKSEVIIVINSENRKQLHRRNDHEIEYRGILYDVRKEENKGNNVVFYAEMDVNEQNLVNNFKIENSKNKTGKNSKAQINGKDFSRIYIVSFLSNNFYKKILSKINSPFTSKYNSPDLQQNTPPPQFIIAYC